MLIIISLVLFLVSISAVSAVDYVDTGIIAETNDIDAIDISQEYTNVNDIISTENENVFDDDIIDEDTISDDIQTDEKLGQSPDDDVLGDGELSLTQVGGSNSYSAGDTVYLKMGTFSMASGSDTITIYRNNAVYGTTTYSQATSSSGVPVVLLAGTNNIYFSYTNFLYGKLTSNVLTFTTSSGGDSGNTNGTNPLSVSVSATKYQVYVGEGVNVTYVVDTSPYPESEIDKYTERMKVYMDGVDITSTILSYANNPDMALWVLPEDASNPQEGFYVGFTDPGNYTFVIEYPGNGYFAAVNGSVTIEVLANNIDTNGTNDTNGSEEIETQIKLRDGATNSTSVTVNVGDTVSLSAYMPYDYYVLQMSTNAGFSSSTTIAYDDGHEYWHNIATYTFNNAGTYYFRLMNYYGRYDDYSNIVSYTVVNSITPVDNGTNDTNDTNGTGDDNDTNSSTEGSNPLSILINADSYQINAGDSVNVTYVVNTYPYPESEIDKESERMKVYLNGEDVTNAILSLADDPDMALCVLPEDASNPQGGFVFSFSDSGNYTFVIEYPGNSYFAAVNSSITIEVIENTPDTNDTEEKAPVIVNAYSNATSGIVNDTFKISWNVNTLAWSNNLIGENETVRVYINGVDYTENIGSSYLKVKDENSYAGSNSFILTTASEGIYTIVIEYCGNDVFEAGNSTVIVLNISDMSDEGTDNGTDDNQSESEYSMIINHVVRVGDSIVLTGVLKDDISGIVYYYDNGTQIGVAATGSPFSYNFTTVGIHNISSVCGDYEDSSLIVVVESESNENNTNPTEFSKIGTQFEFSDMNTTVIVSERSGEYFYAVLKDADGNPLAGKFVQIGFNGKIYNRTTNASGGFRLQVNLNISAGYTFALSFLGDDEYNGTFGVAKIRVSTVKPTITGKSVTYKSSASSKTISATLKCNGTPIAKKRITFRVDGKIYFAYTDSNGVASVKVSLTTKKTYAYTATFEGNTMYGAVTASSQIKIN